MVTPATWLADCVQTRGGCIVVEYLCLDLRSWDSTLTCASASRQLAPGGGNLHIMSVHGLHEAMFDIAGALYDEGQSGFTCLVCCWCC